MSDAIATYSERRFDGRREFVLFPDKVEISGNASLGARFAVTVQLNSLVPVADRLWARSPGFWQGVVMAIVCVTLAQASASVLSRYWIGLLWVIAVGGALLAAATARRIEWAVFKNSAGAEVLTVAKAGPSRAEFEQFVSSIAHAIEASGGGQGSGPSAA